MNVDEDYKILRNYLAYECHGEGKERLVGVRLILRWMNTKKVFGRATEKVSN